MLLLSCVTGMARAEVNIGKSFELSLVDKNIQFLDYEEIRLNSYHFGVGLSVDKFFFSYAAEQSLREETNFLPGAGNAGFEKFSRDDYSYTLGYSLPHGFSIYAGHKVGKLFIDQYVLPVNELRRQSYVDRGNFAGASFTQNAGGMGVFVISAAYGKFDNRAQIDPFDQTFEGETKGYSYGLDWRYPFSENVYLRIGYKLHDYDMDVSEYPMVAEQERPQEIKNFYLGVAGYY